MTKLFSRKEMLSRVFGARKAKRLEVSLQSNNHSFGLLPYKKKTGNWLKGHFVFSDTKEGHDFWWGVAEKTEKLGYTEN